MKKLLLLFSLVFYSASTFADSFLWLYVDMRNWEFRDGVLYGDCNPVFFDCYADEQVEINGRSYAIMYVSYPNIRTSRSTVDNSKSDDGRMFALGVRKENSKVLADYDEYMDYLHHRGYSELYDGTYSRGDSTYVPYPVTDDGEVVLYDFGLDQGSTYCQTADGRSVIVEVKDTVALNDGKARCRLTLSNGMVLIEGIGCINSPGMLLDYLNPQESYKANYCFLDNCKKDDYFSGEDVVIYKTSASYYDNYTLRVEENEFNFMQGSKLLFDLQGRAVRGGNLRGGLYIRDGRKYVGRPTCEK